MHLAHSLNNLGRVEQATRATQIYYRQSIAHPTRWLIPFWERKAESLSTEILIDCISEIFKDSIFISSIVLHRSKQQ